MIENENRFDNSLYSSLLNKNVILRTSRGQLIYGKLISIDGYVNVCLTKVRVSGTENEYLSSILVKGSCVDWIGSVD